MYSVEVSDDAEAKIQPNLFDSLNETVAATDHVHGDSPQVPDSTTQASGSTKSASGSTTQAPGSTSHAPSDITNEPRMLDASNLLSARLADLMSPDDDEEESAPKVKKE